MPEFAPVTIAFCPCSGLVGFMRRSFTASEEVRLGARFVTRVTKRGRRRTCRDTSKESTMSIVSIVSRTRDRLLATAEGLSWLAPTLARVTLGLVFVGTGWGKLHSLGNVTS